MDMVNCLSAFEKEGELADVARKVTKVTLKPGTKSNYEGLIKDFKQFLQTYDYSKMPKEKNVSHFSLYLEKK